MVFLWFLIVFSDGLIDHLAPEPDVIGINWGGGTHNDGCNWGVIKSRCPECPKHSVRVSFVQIGLSPLLLRL